MNIEEIMLMKQPGKIIYKKYIYNIKERKWLSPQNPDDTLSHSTCYIYITTAMKFCPCEFAGNEPAITSMVNEEGSNSNIQNYLILKSMEDASFVTI